MPVSDEQLAVAAVWLQQHVAAAQQIEDAAQQAAKSTWATFEGWYTTAAVTAVAAEMAQLSQASQDRVTGTAQSFIANVIAVLRGTRVTIPPTILPPVRGENAPLTLVHTRPAEAYRKAFATGATHEEAVDVAVQRAATLQLGDIKLAERATQQATMDALEVTQYRRIVHPELSKTGSCGLCIVAADRIYTVAELMPIHPPTCNCKTMPIVGDNDPGRTMNERDLARFYEDAGGTTARDALARTRYQVNEHGEYGPVLTKADDAFRGPANVRLEDDPARAARMLAKALPVLDRLEADGGPNEPLQYQRDLVTRLTGITAAAA